MKHFLPHAFTTAWSFFCATLPALLVYPLGFRYLENSEFIFLLQSFALLGFSSFAQLGIPIQATKSIVNGSYGGMARDLIVMSMSSMVVAIASISYLVVVSDYALNWIALSSFACVIVLKNVLSLFGQIWSGLGRIALDKGLINPINNLSVPFAALVAYLWNGSLEGMFFNAFIILVVVCGLFGLGLVRRALWFSAEISKSGIFWLGDSIRYFGVTLSGAVVFTGSVLFVSCLASENFSKLFLTIFKFVSLPLAVISTGLAVIFPLFVRGDFVTFFKALAVRNVSLLLLFSLMVMGCYGVLLHFMWPVLGMDAVLSLDGYTITMIAISAYTAMKTIVQIFVTYLVSAQMDDYKAWIAINCIEIVFVFCGWFVLALAGLEVYFWVPLLVGGIVSFYGYSRQMIGGSTE